MRDTGFHSLLPSNRIDHKKRADYNKDNNEETSEPIVLQVPSSCGAYLFESFRSLRLRPLTEYFRNYTKTVPKNQGAILFWLTGLSWVNANGAEWVKMTV